MMENFKEVEAHVMGRLDRELPKDLSYHGVHHTQDVLRSAQIIGADEKVSDKEMLLLKTAVLYHDVGFTQVYKNHEEVGCNIAREELPEFGYNKDDIETICGMIMATKIPQSPKNKLERIIADADLEYLGRDDFEAIGKTLFQEMKVYFNLDDEREWNLIQINFLKNHHYHTDFCKKNREAQKQKYLQQIVELVDGEK